MCFDTILSNEYFFYSGRLQQPFSEKLDVAYKGCKVPNLVYIKFVQNFHINVNDQYLRSFKGGSTLFLTFF